MYAPRGIMLLSNSEGGYPERNGLGAEGDTKTVKELVASS